MGLRSTRRRIRTRRSWRDSSTCRRDVLSSTSWASATRRRQNDCRLRSISLTCPSACFASVSRARGSRPKRSRRSSRRGWPSDPARNTATPRGAPSPGRDDEPTRGCAPRDRVGTRCAGAELGVGRRFGREREGGAANDTGYRCGGARRRLLFASSGLEPEIVREAEVIEVLPQLRGPVARVPHLIAMKVLARDDRARPQDYDDIVALLGVANAKDIGRVRELLETVEVRGFNRRREARRGLRRAAQFDCQRSPSHVKPRIRYGMACEESWPVRLGCWSHQFATTSAVGLLNAAPGSSQKE